MATLPFEYPEEFVGNRILVLTTTNGTKLLHMALDNGAEKLSLVRFPIYLLFVEHLVMKKKMLFSDVRHGKTG